MVGFGGNGFFWESWSGTGVGAAAVLAIVGLIHGRKMEER
jgi:hypothetical protein